MPQTPDPVHRY